MTDHVSLRRDRPAALALLLGLSLACLSWQSATQVGLDSPGIDVSTMTPVPLALENGAGTYDLWSAIEETGAAALQIKDIDFLPIRAVGQRAVDALRLDRPSTAGVGSAAPSIRLPKRGSLYRVRRDTRTGILHVDASGLARMVLEVPDVGGQPSLLDGLGVSWRGDNALVATTVAAGGDIYMLDLVGLGSTKLLSANVGPLAIDADSLRVSRRAAWLTADGDLWCATDPASGNLSLKLPLVPGDALPELVQSRNGESVAVYYEEAPGERRLVVASRNGGTTVITKQASDYSLPGLDDPLGPWVALSPDGGMVAFMTRESPWHGKWSHEIFVREVGSAQPVLKVTEEPSFPVYIDNVGVLGFVHDRVLTFFAGDEFLSGIPAEDGVGAADWFAADFKGGKTQPVVKNLTGTSGDPVPPFDQPGQLSFKEVLVDPLAERFLLTGAPVAGAADFLVSTAIDPDDWDTTAQELLTGVVGDVQLVGAGSEVLVVSPDHGDDCEDELAVDLLRPLDDTLAGMWSVTSLDDDETMDRIVGRGGVVGTVIDTGWKRKPAFILGSTGQLVTVGLKAPEVSPLIRVGDAGRMTFGFGPVGGPYQFVSVDVDRNATLLAVPATKGFPLH